MPAACGAVANRDELDGAGDDGSQLLIGLASPLQPLAVDDEDVDVAVADGSLACGERVVAVDACVDVDRVALCLDGLGQFGGDGTGHADVFGASAAAQQRGQDDDAGDDNDHHDQRREEGPRAAALAHLSRRDEPGLPGAVHAATA